MTIDHIDFDSGQENVEESVKEYSSAWVVEITEGMAGRSNNLKLKTDHGCTLASLESWLTTPNRKDEN